MTCFCCRKPIDYRKTHYFCVSCFCRLHEQFPLTPKRLEEYLNLSFRDVYEFQLSHAENVLIAYDFARLTIPDIRPRANIGEYILLYKLTYFKAPCNSGVIL